MSLPNIITLVRMALVPLVVWLIVEGEWAAAFWLFVIAGLSDAVDGMIAKRFNQATLLGAYLDPVADKLLLGGVFVTLGIIDVLPKWLIFLIISRDIMIVVAFAIAYLVARPIKIRPLRVSKLNTAAQIVLACGELARLAFTLDVPDGARLAAIGAVAGLTAVSWIVYFAVWMRHLAGSPAAEPEPAPSSPSPGEAGARGRPSASGSG